MAKNLKISASYLNLIEHNRRSITVDLAERFASVYGVDVEALSGRREARLRDHLQEVLGDELFKEYRLRRGDLDDLVAREPQLCRAFLGLYGAYRKGHEELRVLSEHLANDPTLVDSHHKLLTTLTSLRSFAEIMRDNTDLADTKRSEFAEILVEESQSLTDQIRQLFRFIGEGGLGPSSAAELPRDEVIDAFQANMNHYERLEQRAAEWLEDLPGPGPRPGVRPESFEDLRHVAESRWGLRVTAVGMEDTPAEEEPPSRPGHAGCGWRLDLDDGRLYLAGSLPEASRRFLLLKAVCQRCFAADLDSLTGKAELSSPQAAALYRSGLAGYFAGAVMMPYDDFLQAAEDVRHDLEALQHAFAASFEQVALRLTTLHRPGSEGVPFHFLRSDIAGNIDKRFSASGLGLPRYGGICPLWNLHQAFLQPGRILRQIVEIPGGARYMLIARTVAKPKSRFSDPERVFSISLGCDVSFAHKLVYAQDMDLGAARPVPAGIGCRQCPRENCVHRAHPSVIGFAESALAQGDIGATVALS
jgi:predicted transcriptional regulator